MNTANLGSDGTCNGSTVAHYLAFKAGNPTHSLNGQHISMIGHDHPSQQGVYVMDSSFHHGTDPDKQNSFVESVNMIQLNKCMAADSKSYSIWFSERDVLGLGIDADKRNWSAERINMIQLNKSMVDNSSHAGQRCERLGCNEVVKGQTVFRKNHRVSQQCQMVGCPHIVPDGLVLCLSHGGGHPLGEPGSSAVPFAKSELSIKYEGDNPFRMTGNVGNATGSKGIYTLDGEVVMCKYQGCSKRGQGNATYCKVHSGGSKTCMVQGCTKGAHGGTSLCIGHGGGKRCAVTGCPNAACGSNQGRTDCCVRHGGGKRCKYNRCGKGAQGNTDFCIAHGGGRRCKFEECGKSAQGRSDYCIKHGGGRRCKFQGCSANAKWGVDFCCTHRKILLGGSNSSHEMLPTPPPKRRAKKAKKAKSTVEPAGLSSETVTMSAIPGNVMPKMGIHVAAAGSDLTSVMKHSAIGRQQPLQASTKSMP